MFWKAEGRFGQSGGGAADGEGSFKRTRARGRRVEIYVGFRNGRARSGVKRAGGRITRRFRGTGARPINADRSTRRNRFSDIFSFRVLAKRDRKHFRPFTPFQRTGRRRRDRSYTPATWIAPARTRPGNRRVVHSSSDRYDRPGLPGFPVLVDTVRLIVSRRSAPIENTDDRRRSLLNMARQPTLWERGSECGPYRLRPPCDIIELERIAGSRDLTLGRDR